MKNENQIVNLLADQLKERYKKIHIRKFPSNSSKVRNYLKNKLGYIPFLRPEIDMIFFEKSGLINAVEVKYFKNFDKKTPFYKGIDQALSLLRYGFDNVALWHFFSKDIPLTTINEYGPETWHFVRNSLKLNLDFSYFHINEKQEGIKFEVLQYKSRKSGFYLKSTIDDPSFNIRFKYGNPLRINGDSFTLTMREALLKYL